MTDQELIQTIKAIVDESVSKSEERTTGRMVEIVAESEERMSGRMVEIVMESEERTSKKILDLKALIEGDVEKKICQVAEGQQMLAEKFARIDEMADDMDEIKGEIVALSSSIVTNEKKIIELQKARG